MADADDVVADGRAAEAGIERRRAGDLGGGDLGELADAGEGFIGQVAVVGLDGLEDGHGGGGGAAFGGAELIDKGQVERRRGCGGGAGVGELGRRGEGGARGGLGRGGRGEAPFGDGQRKPAAAASRTSERTLMRVRRARM